MPFFIAFAYAVYAKITSARRDATSDEEMPSEQTPLLAEDVRGPEAVPLVTES